MLRGGDSNDERNSKKSHDVAENHCKNNNHAPDDLSCREAHCIASCEIVREYGRDTANACGVGKEIFDGRKAAVGGGGDGYDKGDMNADQAGGASAAKNGSCEDLCKGQR